MAKATYHRKATFAEVVKAERRSIHRRRTGAGISPSDPTADDANATTGLALSGGGIRSAAFNLGFVQSLYKRGILRQIDYLSTVSGGGYIGSYLSSLAATNRDSNDDGPSPRSASPLLRSSDGSTSQPSAVRRLIHGGRSLKNHWVFFNRHCFGILAVNAVAFTGLMAVAAFAAYIFRLLDRPEAINWMFAMGVETDVGRSMFPSIVFFACWICAWLAFDVVYLGMQVLLFLRRKAPAATAVSVSPTKGMGRLASAKALVTGILFWCGVTAAVLGFVTILATGDIDISSFSAGRDKDSLLIPNREQKKDFQSAIVVGLLTGLGAALLPYLRPSALLRSGTRPKNALESWVFSIASYAVVLGVPLLVFGWFARENISDHNQTLVQQYELSSTNLPEPPASPNWGDFWERIELDARRAQHANRENDATTDWDFAASLWCVVNGHTNHIESRKDGVFVFRPTMGDLQSLFQDRDFEVRRISRSEREFRKVVSHASWGHRLVGMPIGVMQSSENEFFHACGENLNRVFFEDDVNPVKYAHDFRNDLRDAKDRFIRRMRAQL